MIIHLFFYVLNYIIRYQGTLLLLLLFSFAKNWIDSKIELNKQKKNINESARSSHYLEVAGLEVGGMYTFRPNLNKCALLFVYVCLRVSVGVWVLAFALLFFCWSYLWKYYKCIFSVNNFLKAIAFYYVLHFFFHKYQSSLLVFCISLVFTTIRIQVVLYSIINFTFEYGRFLTRFFFVYFLILHD